MASVFRPLVGQGPATVIVKAILVAIAANLLLLSFILIRRMYRRRFFAKRDARLLEYRRNWDAVVCGRIPFTSWRSKRFDLRIVEDIALDAFETADRDEAARLLRFLRASGLIEKLIFEARQHKGWRKNRALVDLGRARAPEGVPALAEGLRDRKLETQLAAVRGLGRTACPEAGKELLQWVAETGLQVPALPLQTSLIECCSERPRMLLPFLQSSDKPTREVLGRVLGEIATPTLGRDLLQFVEDEQPELRAAAARALSHSDRGMAVDALIQLAQDPVWFVRLRAVVSLGKLRHSTALPPLLRCIRDANRLVRLRAAEALLDVGADNVRVFEQVVAANDRYALHAFLTALDNATLQADLRKQIEMDQRLSQQIRSIFLQVLRTGNLPAEMSGNAEMAMARAASHP